MKKLLFLLLPLFAFADTFILQSEKLEDNGNTFWIITLCKDGYQYTLTKQEPLGYTGIVQDFEKISPNSRYQPIKCQQDFKQPSQFPKD